LIGHACRIPRFYSAKKNGESRTETARLSALSERLIRLRETLSSNPRSGTNEKVEAVVGVLLRQEAANELSTLLIQRVERNNDPWSGQIGLPGGRVEKFDGSTQDALEREVREEVGIDLGIDGEPLGALTVSHPMRNIEMRVQPFVYGLRRRPEVNVGPEVQEAFWVSLFKLPSVRELSEVEIRGMRREVESFLVDGRIVWGFTYRVLSELLAVPDVLG